MKNTGIVTLAIVILLTWTSLGAAGLKTIKLALVTKPGSAQYIAAEKFKALIEEKAGDAWQVKMYHSASVGNETEILQQIQMGTIQMGVITGGLLIPLIPLSG